MRIATCAAGLTIVLAIGCSSNGGVGAPERSPFPLAQGLRWTYDGHFEGKVYRNTLALLPAGDADGKRYLGFFDVEVKTEGQLLMGNMFGDELFREDDGTIFVADEHHVDEEHALLRLPLEKGASTEYRVGSRTTRTLVEGEDQVTVPAGTYSCVRLVVTETYDSGDVSSHTVWLAPGVGLVKWKRSTGRTDELVRFGVECPRTPEPGLPLLDACRTGR